MRAHMCLCICQVRPLRGFADLLKVRGVIVEFAKRVLALPTLCTIVHQWHLSGFFAFLKGNALKD